MRNTTLGKLILPFLLLITSSVFAKNNIDSIPSYSRFGVSLDVLKLSTILPGRNYKSDFMLRYYPYKFIYLSANVGRSIVNYHDLKYNYTLHTRGGFGQVGLCLNPKLMEDSKLLLGYNFGYSKYSNYETATIKSDFWGDEVNYTSEKRFGQKVFHDFYCGVHQELKKINDVTIFYELIARLRLGVSNAKKSEEKFHFPGYGRFNHESGFYLALNCQVGIKF